MMHCQRAAFSIPRDVHYLNCAYMGPLPRVAEEAGVRALRRKVVPTEIGPEDFFRESDRLRALFAGLLGGVDPARVAIHPGVSYGVATAARNLPVGRGQNVVLLHEQFPGNVYAWTRAAREAGAEVRTVRPPGGAVSPGGTASSGSEEGRGAAWNQRLLEAVDARTAVVAVPHVHWTDGTRFDLEALGARCRDVGAALVVDGTQSVGALPFDVAAVRPDVLVTAVYKWLLGPYSLALTYLSERFDDGTPLEETWIGRAGSQDFQRLVDYQERYQPGAVRYDVAERSNFALNPVAIASLELVTEWGPGNIQEYCRGLTAGLVAEARELGFAVEDERWRAHHLFGLRMPEGIDLASLKEALQRRKIHASLRGSALRLAPNVYNDGADVEALMEVMREAAGRPPA